MRFGWRWLWRWETGILLLAVTMRLTLLESKPPHFDEGVNGWFADQIAAKGFYAYDPTNFHGPWYFYLVHASQTLLGRNLTALRLPAVLGSILAVWLLLRFSPWVGTPGARLAALAMAVSPAFVFYGRYSIHESWFLSFNILTFWGVLRLWNRGDGKGWAALLTGLTGMVLTKETYVIHAGCLLLAWPCLWLWNRLVAPSPPRPWSENNTSPLKIAAGVLGALGAVVAFYSGFGMHWKGVTGIWETYAAWFATGLKDGGHEKSEFDWIGPLNGYWLWLMAVWELPALAGLAACARYLWPSPSQLRLIAIYGGGLLAAYTVIPYKTPWCLISFTWPFLLMFGAMATELYRHFPRPTLGLALLLSAISLGQSMRLNFRDHSRHEHPYVYVQTDMELERFTRPVQQAVSLSPALKHQRGTVLLESYYPLPWILGDFTNIHYGENEVEKQRNFTGLFVMIEQSRADEIQERVPKEWMPVPFRLRDGMEDVVVFFAPEISTHAIEPRERKAIPVTP
jgi:uncharacterized protein (TIGR03663 family)